MNAHRVPSLGADPPAADAILWGTVPSETVDLSPVPLDAVDTSKYVSQTIDRAQIGTVDAITVRMAYDHERFAVKLSWDDPTRDDAVTATEEFADKAAVAFPLAPGASVMSMGSGTAPINAWYWRADRSRAYDVIARGFGDVERREAAMSGLSTAAKYINETWHVVLARERPVADDQFVDLSTAPAGIAFAIWDGQNGERGPLKAYSGEFETIGFE